MLFFAFEFLYIFMPVLLLGYFSLARMSPGNVKLCTLWLIACSLVFYGYWNPVYLLLLGTSIGVNYTVGRYLYQHKLRTLFILAVVFNLGLLSYYKYLGFFADIFNALSGQAVDVGQIILPLAISFFTFQQIAWVVDNYLGRVEEGRVGFDEYLLFVVFFPQLIAGPIVHHSELIPQFRHPAITRYDANNFATGVAIFIIGMFKKVVLADNIAPTADVIFGGAAWGITYSAFDTWVAAVAYPIQVYFDFSAYGDMAIGLGLMFNIRLPVNFESPFRAATYVEYWRRWHMTLGRFMRTYVYIPLGGNRVLLPRAYFNAIITLTLAGMWHGAGWTFLLWGFFHGVLQVVNQIWMQFTPWRLPLLLAWFLTYLGTTVVHVFFPSHDLDSAIRVLEVMFFLSDAPAQDANLSMGAYALVGAAFVGTLILPNSRQLIGDHFQPLQFDSNTISARTALRIPVLDDLRIHWNWQWLLFLSAVALASLYTLLASSTVQEFVYFQF